MHLKIVLNTDQDLNFRQKEKIKGTSRVKLNEEYCGFLKIIRSFIL